ANDGREESAVVETLDRMSQAMEHKDVAALASVLHDDLTWGHSTGATQTKEQLVKELGGAEVYELFKFSNFSIHIYGSTAVVRCTADIRNGAPPAKPMHQGHFNCLIVLVKGPNGWQIVGGQRAHVDEKGS
ncbi:MAG: nuclear transport factor 2 family protein, partial [Candidatus Acidiferrales bacterium]